MPQTESNDRYAQFVAQFARHERAIRGVVRATVPSLQDADDVMQEVGLACWHKFADFRPDDSSDSFLKWACVVAKFEILRFRRRCARDRLVLSEETIAQLVVDAEHRLDTSERERQALEDCLLKLPLADQQLLLSVHTRGDSVAKIARQLGQNVRRLYSRVNALRDMLGECVRRTLAERSVQDA